jgi:alkylation response protein AidB-like acyl-CoA dehydrogenase
MELELTEEQSWISESIDALLSREWVAPQDVATATGERRRRVWTALVAFGALGIGGGTAGGDEGGLEAVELCLIARALGSHLASLPFLGSAAVRLALAPQAGSLPLGLAGLLSGQDAIGVALLEAGSGWTVERAGTRLARGSDGLKIRGEKVSIDQLQAVDQLAVVATLDGEPALVVTPAGAAGLMRHAQRCFDQTVPMGTARFDAVPVPGSGVLGGPEARQVLRRLMTAGSLLAAAEAVGAAGHILDLACRYAGERRQFGRTIGSFQALRHILADAYVRQESGWSAVRYAAAALDDGDPEAAQAASIAKAYVSRGAREVAHSAMQVFGGIAFTAEHPAHRFLRRIGVRAQQFGDAAHHERRLGRELAERVSQARSALSSPVLAEAASA